MLPDEAVFRNGDQLPFPLSRKWRDNRRLSGPCHHEPDQLKYIYSGMSANSAGTTIANATPTNFITGLYLT